MRLIAELQGAAENDNGRAPTSRDVGAGEGAASRVLDAASHNDGPGRAVETLVLFLQPDVPVGGAHYVDDECDSDIVVLPILRPANDDEAEPDVEAILRDDPVFAQILDEARERWIEWMDAKAQTEAEQPAADDPQPSPEGDDDHDCA